MEIPLCDQRAESGCLYIVPTPIGNLSDVSVRALAILGSCDIIACEDTRVTKKLLQYFSIQKKLISYRDENEKQRTEELVKELQSEKSVALVSDAGTPGISDPGFRLTRECQKRGIRVTPLPGACAFVTLLSGSGLPSDNFQFFGFLPPKSSTRRRFFEEHVETEHTLALYESPHRIEKFLSELLEILGPERAISLGKELTKKFEKILTGKSSEVVERFQAMSKKGEYVVLIAPRSFEL